MVSDCFGVVNGQTGCVFCPQFCSHCILNKCTLWGEPCIALQELIAKNCWQRKRYMQKEAGSYRTGIPMAGCSIVTIISDDHWPLCSHKSTSHPIVASGSPFDGALAQPRCDALCQTAEPAHPHVNSTTCTYHCEVLTNDMHIIAYKIVTGKHHNKDL